jgi:hypothetical protein
MKRLPVAVVLVWSVAAASATVGGDDAARPIDVRVDPRVELASIVFRLAGNPEYSASRFEPYVRDVETHFGPFRDHEAVKFAAELRRRRGVSYDAPATLAIHLTEPPELAERMPLRAAKLDNRWRPNEASKFVALLRRFAADSRFSEFFDAHRDMYAAAEERMRAAVSQHLDPAWFSKFFGVSAELKIVLAMLNGPHFYGTRYVPKTGAPEFYAILAFGRYDEAGIPTYERSIVPFLSHELSHSFANPLIDRHASELRKAGERIFAAVEDQMRAQAYGAWKTVLYESLTRAAECRHTLDHFGPQAAAASIVDHREKGFIWMRDLHELLGQYARDRERYPTLESFMPRIVAFFNDLAPRIRPELAAYEASRPKVLSVTPANGAKDVDPATTEIVITFDQPMAGGYVTYAGSDGREFYPPTDSHGYDETRSVFKMQVRLEPGREYRLQLNSQWHRNFQSAEGVPLEPYVVQFRTRDP